MGLSRFSLCVEKGAEAVSVHLCVYVVGCSLCKVLSLTVCVVCVSYLNARASLLFPPLYQQNHREGERGIRLDGSAPPEGKREVPSNPSQENSGELLPSKNPIPTQPNPIQ